MTTELEDGGSTNQITLKPKLDLGASEELAGQLMALRGTDVIIDANAVEHFGAHGVQTLMVAAQSWHRDGRRLSITRLSETARKHLAVMGLDHTAFEGNRGNA